MSGESVSHLRCCDVLLLLQLLLLLALLIAGQVGRVSGNVDSEGTPRHVVT